MKESESQFNIARPEDKSETEKVKKQKAQEIQKEIDQISDGKPLENLELKDLKEILKKYQEIEKVLGIKSASPEPILAESPEGEPLEFNLEKIRADSIQFYRDNNLEELIKELPETISLTKEQTKTIQEKVKESGFNKMFLFPSIETQLKYLEKIKTETGKPMEGLDEKNQYSKERIWLSDTVKEDFPEKIKILNRPKEKCYLLLYQDSQEVPEETRNKTALQARKIQKEKNETGFTLPEYLIFQRDFISRNKGKENSHPEHKYATWLTDSELVSSHVLWARWYLSDHQLSVFSYFTGLRSSSQGFRSSAVLEI